VIFRKPVKCCWCDSPDSHEQTLEKWKQLQMIRMFAALEE